MAINPTDLGLRTGNISIGFGPASMSLSLAWEGYHLTLGDVIGSGMVSQSVAKIGDLAATYDILLTAAASEFGSLQVRHKGIGAIGNLSPHDADLVLDAWAFAAGKMKHPISGEFIASPAGLIATVNAIVAVVLPPPVWVWAESVQAGQLRVKYITVPGAITYNVYNGTALLGSVTGTGWKTLAVPDGQYQARIAPVSAAGVVGICSFAVPVTVGTAGAPEAMLADAGLVAADDAEPQPKKPWWQRVSIK